MDWERQTLEVCIDDDWHFDLIAVVFEFEFCARRREDEDRRLKVLALTECRVLVQYILSREVAEATFAEEEAVRIFAQSIEELREVLDPGIVTGPEKQIDLYVVLFARNI